MSKLGLLKDSDFKKMHDGKLPVAQEQTDYVQEFVSTIEADVKFLESLYVMDYSLFVIIVKLPPEPEVDVLADTFKQNFEPDEEQKKAAALHSMID